MESAAAESTFDESDGYFCSCDLSEAFVNDGNKMEHTTKKVIFITTTAFLNNSI